jgi:hypothetical protein
VELRVAARQLHERVFDETEIDLRGYLGSDLLAGHPVSDVDMIGNNIGKVSNDVAAIEGKAKRTAYLKL